MVLISVIKANQNLEEKGACRIRTPSKKVNDASYLRQQILASLRVEIREVEIERTEQGHSQWSLRLI